MKAFAFSTFIYKNKFLIFSIFLLGILIPSFFIMKGKENYEGTACGGGWGQYPEFCDPGFLCDYSKSDVDGPGRCVKLRLGKSYEINARNQLYFKEENLYISSERMHEECEALNPAWQTSEWQAKGCDKAKVTWNIIVKKGNKSEVVNIDSLSDGKHQIRALGYNFIFEKINIVWIRLTVLH